MRLRPDDEVYRVDAVWLGPQGFTLPWVARYSAYGIWLTLFVAVLLFEAVTPLTVGIPPMWEFVFTVLATYALMGVVDHERPVATVVQTVTGRAARTTAAEADTTAARHHQASPHQGRRLMRRRERHRAAELRLALREINGHLTYTDSAVWAWYVLPSQQWAFRSESQRESLILSGGDALSALGGRRVHVRVTHRPYPVAAWARRLHGLTPVADAGLARPPGRDPAASAHPDDGREGGLPRRPPHRPLHHQPRHRQDAAPHHQTRGGQARPHASTASPRRSRCPAWRAARSPPPSWSGCCAAPPRCACRRRCTCPRSATTIGTPTTCTR